VPHCGGKLVDRVGIIRNFPLVRVRRFEKLAACNRAEYPLEKFFEKSIRKLPEPGYIRT